MNSLDHATLSCSVTDVRVSSTTKQRICTSKYAIHNEIKDGLGRMIVFHRHSHGYAWVHCYFNGVNYNTGAGVFTDRVHGSLKQVRPAPSLLTSDLHLEPGGSRGNVTCAEAS